MVFAKSEQMGLGTCTSKSYLSSLMYNTIWVHIQLMLWACMNSIY